MKPLDEAGKIGSVRVGHPSIVSAYSISKSSESLLLRLVVLEHCLRLRALTQMIWKRNYLLRAALAGARLAAGFVATFTAGLAAALTAGLGIAIFFAADGPVIWGAAGLFGKVFASTIKALTSG